MPYDSSKFTAHLRKNAARNSQARCAKFVRSALEAGGANTIGHPVAAKLYGPILTRNGFHAIPVENPKTFGFLAGDIVVIEPPTQGNQSGHIAGYDGKNWISDFVQRGFWPGPVYEREEPGYAVYRP